MSADKLDAALRDVSAWSEDLLAHLVACPSVTGQSTEIMDLLEPMLRNLSFTVEVIPIDPATLAANPEYSPPSSVRGPQPPILHARYRDNLAPGPGAHGDLLLFAHTDTEPVHDGWVQDPYEMVVDDGRAWGLGVADDKSGIVSILAAVRAVQDAGTEMTWRPRILFGSGKQGGALGTLPGILAAEGVSEAVYCHPAESGGGLAHLKVASRGLVQIEIRVDGLTPAPREERTPMSADPRLGRNAALRAARLAASLAVAEDDQMIRDVTALTAEAGAFEVPNVASFVMACWFSAGDWHSAVTGLKLRLDALATDGWERDHPPALRAVGLRANPASCAGSPFARWASNVIEEITGAQVEDYSWHSASDIRFPIRCLGVPAVGFGASAGGFYGPGEWVDLASLNATTEVLARMLTNEEGP
jgi:acetylornithine deacetylase